MADQQLLLERGTVYEILMRFEVKPLEEIKKMGVCLQDQEICSNWEQVNFVKTHAFKDNSKPRVLEWDIWIDPQTSRSDFGVKVICSQIFSIRKEKILKPIYRLPPQKIEELNAKILWGIGLPHSLLTEF